MSHKPARRANQRFDRELFTLKLSALSRQMQVKSLASDRQAAAASRETAGSFLVNIVDGQLVLLREWLERVDRICRDVWQIQGEAVTPEFVRGILMPEAMMLIGARGGAIKSIVTLAAVRKRLKHSYPAQHHLAMGVNRIKSEITNGYEIEARELEYQKAPAERGGPQGQLDEQRSIRGPIKDATKNKTAMLANADILESSSASWPEIEIAFLSDERVEICRGDSSRKTYNYDELGFGDRRSGKPNRAWVTMREISGRDGAIPRPSPGKGRAMIQKRIQEIRVWLRGHFGIQTDPIPFNGNTYQASFKITRRPSFET